MRVRYILCHVFLCMYGTHLVVYFRVLLEVKYSSESETTDLAHMLLPLVVLSLVSLKFVRIRRSIKHERGANMMKLRHNNGGKSNITR